MLAIRKKLYRQFDQQTNDRQIAFVNMNNLYLAIERDEVELNRRTGNALWNLLDTVYPAREDIDKIISMRQYWISEFEKLSNWNQW